jgi:heme A synthase
MRTAAYIFPITSIVVFLQAITGAATVLNFYAFGDHMTTGYLVGVLALLSTLVAFTSKPKYAALRYASLVLLALVIVQGGIGIVAETSDSLVVAHFVNALILFGTSIAIVFYSFRWGRMQAAPTTKV